MLDRIAIEMQEPIINEANIAWLAGLFEGEGCMSIAKNGGTRLTIRMTDRDVIEQVFAMFPSTRIQVVEPQQDNWKTQYAWRVSDPSKVREILGLLLPWFGERRAARARELLHHLDTRPGLGHWAKRTQCVNGHEFSEENTYVNPNNGYRSCRTCSAAAQRRAYQRRKANSLGQVISA
ncbi:HNH endonuclease [Mycobacterium phage LittleE]|uniref:HNH endonuclease n=1 Tax=Mycobacterium phage LittleE TaxID=2922212 RepID=G1D3P9_9CAUD|nr:HNH endonuclease [Mycobacterium phage LittleE]AEK09399.1 HNH endonuclease [Mycobacterium phage LittleE]